MPLRLTDTDGAQYVFDDLQKEVVKRLLETAKQKIQLELRVFELETHNAILEAQLQEARKERGEADEVIRDHIAYLDPD